MDGNEFEIDDFERTLREAADRFYMKPSERVWRSIYNDLHPGSKWPSLAVGLFMLLTLFWIGNNNRTNPEIDTATSENTIPQENHERQTDNSVREDRGSLTGETQSQKSTRKLAIVRSIDSYRTGAGHTESAADAASNADNPFTKAEGIPLNNKNAPVIKMTTSPSADTIDKLSARTAPAAAIALASKNDAVAEEYYQNKKSRSKAKSLTWKYYFSPMVTSVTFGGVNLNNSRSTLAYTPISGHQMNVADRLGFVIGGNAYYQLDKKTSIFTGLHLAHMGYNIFGRASRPDLASLTLIDKNGMMYNRVYVSHFSNGKEGRKADITNFNWQFSIPIGIKYDVYATDKFKISLMPGVEPLMVMGSKAYLLSGDAGSYVQDPSLVRKVNINANFGVVTTFEGKSSSWEIGPNFRYQVLSTYDNTYPVKEHFINYGIHIAVGKKK